MKAYVYNGHGGPEVEALADVPRPEPGPGQLLIAVAAAGVVERPGDGVTGFAPGDAVFGNSDAGGFSEFALLSAGVTAHKPAALSFTDAATLPVAAAQIARHDGLTVTGTASAGKQEFVESLGVTHVEYGPGVTDRIRATVTRLGGAPVARARNQEVLDAEALRLVEDGHVRGKVVIEVTA